MPTQEELKVSCLGACSHDAPRKLAERVEFVRDSTRVHLVPEIDPQKQQQELTFEKAGPREKTFFDPQSTTAALVTCGGLSPGLNNVIRSVFLELTHNYGVKRVLGIRDGAGRHVGESRMAVETEGRDVGPSADDKLCVEALDLGIQVGAGTAEIGPPRSGVHGQVHCVECQQEQCGSELPAPCGQHGHGTADQDVEGDAAVEDIA